MEPIPESSSEPIEPVAIEDEKCVEDACESCETRRERVIAEAKAFLERNRFRGWEEQVFALIGGRSVPYCELLSRESLEASMARVARSRSLDLSYLSNERYLSRWSRENTPSDCTARFERVCRRSYTPVREVAGHQVIHDERTPRTSYRCRTPLATITTPYHTNVSYRSEIEPLRKYDVFQLRSWSYPIYKYIYNNDSHSSRPYSYLRSFGSFGTSPVYTPPKMTAEVQLMTTRRSYSGYAYLAGESNFDVTSRPRSTSNFYLSKPYLNVSPYFSKHYESSGLRHFNSYRPRPQYTRYPTYFAPYY
ncbi:hypothetical protein PENTCL1PPCAC_10856 [Pristionchus entomophagus]|uniref:Uncharacterized protein n=1 Tax=Pristionchus entomophagus TaxID=358040 RepID=A0AAV5SZM8_9BILA|nr:hypothetical protein PENTCL1PPCAC_10856 [Pristionchus entomophagus]